MATWALAIARVLMSLLDLDRILYWLDDTSIQKYFFTGIVPLIKGTS